MGNNFRYNLLFWDVGIFFFLDGFIQFLLIMSRACAVEDQDSTAMYLVMPSYAEPFKTEIKQILLKEKNTLCSIKTYKKVFENIEFNIAFSNSKNIKQLIVRTKV